MSDYQDNSHSDGSSVAPVVTEKNKKSDILEAYHAVLEELENTKKNSAHQLPDTEEKRKEREIVKKTAGYSSENIAKDIEEFKKSFSGNISNILERVLGEFSVVHEKLEQELLRLSEIQKAIVSEESQLEEIYGLKKINVDFLDFLKKVEEKKLEWEQEKIRQKKEWEREQENFVYERDHKRKREQEEYDAQKRKTKEIFEGEMQKKREEIDEEKSHLTSQLEELEELRAFRESAEENTQKAITNALEKQDAELKKDFSVEKALLEQKVESEKRLLLEQKKALENLLQDREGMIEEYKKKAEQANLKSQELAVAVITTPRGESSRKEEKGEE